MVPRDQTSDDQLLKLAVVNVVRIVLADGWVLLGIEAPEQM
ncbi:DALR anticodon-binding domain-containing protein [Tuberibacillus sp. Marseille-P3662]|nr:DALR anticodon-binding domain-containing protein [Tuberibacillus sp. Marseille-P3662]